MIKITIEGPQGCGKNTIADVIKNIARKNHRIRSLFVGPPPLVGVNHGDYKLNKQDKECYDIIIICKQGDPK